MAPRATPTSATAASLWLLADDEMVEWLNDTMLLEVDTMTEDDVKAHIENVKSIVEQYKDIVAG